MRIKYCSVCNKNFSTMYRIKYKQIKEWVFTCENRTFKAGRAKKSYRGIGSLTCMNKYMYIYI